VITPPEPELAALAAEFPGWQVFRNRQGALCAWWVGAHDPEHGDLLVVRSATVDGLREQIEAEITKGES
jgi:hypothetical protein